MIFQSPRKRIVYLLSLAIALCICSFAYVRYTSYNSPTATYPWSHFSNEYIGTVVTAEIDETDTIWTFTTGDKKWLPIKYSVDAPYQGENTLTVIENKGHEAMVYLTYIIDNYARLPPYVLFIHGHLYSWHQKIDIYTLIRTLNLPAVDQHGGYINLRCDWRPSCPADLKLLSHDAVPWGQTVYRNETEYVISEEVWSVFFPGEEMPGVLASLCCGQFVASREAILGREKESYVRMRQWLFNTDLKDEITGRVFEKLWAYIFTRRAVNCPSPQSCSCEFFGICEKQIWATPPTELGVLPEDSRWP